MVSVLHLRQIHTNLEDLPMDGLLMDSHHHRHQATTPLWQLPCMLVNMLNNKLHMDMEVLRLQEVLRQGPIVMAIHLRLIILKMCIHNIYMAHPEE
jgi:hypothetical protein